MLAAMPSENNRRLELFRLALVLIDRGNRELPHPLSLHFDDVLHQARILSDDPSAVSPDVTPQAVQLANDMRVYEGLRDALAGVNSIGDVSQTVAHEVLRNLEPRLASAY
ncbi:hypothetical protein [Shinella sumterensis]|jgi:pyrimidine operon attenuation protein/uracil phosphoribosyltransferase|uniref:Uncharacterized protein n=1 Tax=Shinella sumterensis TaxID=1967501 RepID=A0AA50CUB2_9HYPH|nr:hypothetical protein [Shinella sumterensis]WLS00723.1 hypothetical protein Q9313_24485 [Shinella sumterensis]